MKLSCMIVDDEPFAVNLLEEYIAQVPSLQLMFKCYNAMEALEFLKLHTVDLLFIDINMPQLTGMQLVPLLPAGQLFIFTTAYSEFAIESYEKDAVDYLLKPVTFDRFLKAVNKVMKLKKDPGQDIDDDTIYLKSGKVMVQLQYDAILFIEGLKDYVLFHTLSGNHIVYKRMKELEENLPAQFSRVHNSYIINRSHIQKIEDNHAVIKEKRIPVSEKYREIFLKNIHDKLL